MDVEEFFGGKRKRDFEEPEPRPAARPRVQEPYKNNNSEENIENIVSNAPEIGPLDSHELRSMLGALDRRLKKNQQMRMKYTDAPEKFLDSELDLHVEINRLSQLASYPELYEEFVDHGTVEILLGLLSHDNTDIAIGVLDVLSELTDTDVLIDADAGGTKMLEALVSCNLSETLFENLKRMDETQEEDKRGVYNTFAIIENMVEARPVFAEEICEKTEFLSWLLARIRTREFDPNKQYASEILAILLQSSDANRKKFAELEGLEPVLQAIAQYRKIDPRNSDEEEMLENLFDSTCSALMNADNKHQMLRVEGIDLMLRLIIYGCDARRGALKVLAFALEHSASLCDNFVSVLGLKTIFSVFMRKGKHHSSKKLGDEKTVDEHVLAVLVSLFMHLKRGGVGHQRLVRKFFENGFEKVDRIIELHEKYDDQVRRAEKDTGAVDIDGVPADIDPEEAAYLRKLDAGLYNLQLTDLVIAHLLASGESSIRGRIDQLLMQKDIPINDLKRTVESYADTLGEDSQGDIDARKTMKRLLKKISEL
eukprot:Rmarinus@m.24492